MLTSEAERDWLESRGLKPSKWLSREELDALEKAAGAATLGPWVKTYWDTICGRHRIVSQRIENEADTDFIAAANPEVILRLIAEVRALRELRIMQEDDLK